MDLQQLFISCILIGSPAVLLFAVRKHAWNGLPVYNEVVADVPTEPKKRVKYRVSFRTGSLA